ncbi:MAG: N-acetylmuramoyl-L-alanine amidase family protein [Luteolibacter sp.]
MIAICVGHSRGDGGAVSLGGVNEWNFNRKLGRKVVERLDALGIECELIDRYAQSGYTKAMTLLAGCLRSKGAELAVELHFNAASNATATGHEWLHWHTSREGRRAAQCLDKAFVDTFPNHRRRGLIGIQTEQQRGGGFLRRTHCPAVIAEPFFGSTRGDWHFAQDHETEIAHTIARGIAAWKGVSA